MNVLGAMLAAGPVYIYTDAAFSYNHPWVDPVWTDALVADTPADAEWHPCFNINMGYYF